MKISNVKKLFLVIFLFFFVPSQSKADWFLSQFPVPSKEGRISDDEFRFEEKGIECVASKTTFIRNHGKILEYRKLTCGVGVVSAEVNLTCSAPYEMNESAQLIFKNGKDTILPNLICGLIRKAR